MRTCSDHFSHTKFLQLFLSSRLCIEFFPFSLKFLFHLKLGMRFHVSYSSLFLLIYFHLQKSSAVVCARRSAIKIPQVFSSAKLAFLGILDFLQSPFFTLSSRNCCKLVTDSKWRNFTEFAKIFSYIFSHKPNDFTIHSDNCTRRHKRTFNILKDLKARKRKKCDTNNDIDKWWGVEHEKCLSNFLRIEFESMKMREKRFFVIVICIALLRMVRKTVKQSSETRLLNNREAESEVEHFCYVKR